MYPSTERIISALPDLTAEDSDAALQYYQKHRREIDGYIKQHEEAEQGAGMPDQFRAIEKIA